VRTSKCAVPASKKKGKVMHPFFLLAGWHVTVPSGYMVCKHFFLAAFVRKVAPVFSLIFFPAGLWQKKLSRLSRFAVSYFLFFSPLRASACRWPKKSACTRLMATLNSAGGPRGHGRLVVRPLSPVAFPRTPTHATGGAGLTRQYCLRQLIAFARVRARVSVCVSI
jgi:hypothetical protein